MGEPGGLPSMGSHRVRHNWSDLAAAAAAAISYLTVKHYKSSPEDWQWNKDAQHHHLCSITLEVLGSTIKQKRPKALRSESEYIKLSLLTNDMNEKGKIQKNIQTRLQNKWILVTLSVNIQKSTLAIYTQASKWKMMFTRDQAGRATCFLL